jgi:spore maturation protein SpmA
LAGLIVGLLGLLALVLGVYEMLDPGGFDRILASNLGPLFR